MKNFRKKELKKEGYNVNYYDEEKFKEDIMCFNYISYNTINN